jgi:hypothetical protein
MKSPVPLHSVPKWPVCAFGMIHEVVFGVE